MIILRKFLKEVKVKHPKTKKAKVVKKWYYTDKSDKKITDKKTIDYIDKLVIPPAYQDVKIFYERSPKILYMGYDDKRRPQFIYSKAWGLKARAKKLCGLIEFAQMYPKMMQSIKAQMEASTITKNKIIATILRIVTTCYFRIGNIKYENLYKSHGISTIAASHVKFKTEGAVISFIGKKGVHNECVIKDRASINALKELMVQNKTTPDNHLFVYKKDHIWHHIKHTDVNNWLKQYKKHFTSKLFRTLDSNLMMISELHKYGDPTKINVTTRKKNTRDMLIKVSTLVHNTPAICKKDYADPTIIQMYIDHPKKYRKFFITPNSSARIKFINYMKTKC